MQPEKTFPWFTFYTDTFLADTTSMPPAARGALITLMCLYWRRMGVLSADRAELARLAGVSGADLESALALFWEDACGLHHEGLDKELEKAVNWRAKCALGGKRSRKSHRKEAVMREHYPSRVLEVTKDKDKDKNKDTLGIKISESNYDSLDKAGLVKQVLGGRVLTDQELEALDPAARSILPALRKVPGGHAIDADAPVHRPVMMTPDYSHD